MLSHILRNRTETEHRIENVHKFYYIFFGFGRPILANTTGNFTYNCTYTTTCIVYNLVIMDAIDGLSSQTIVLLFYKYKPTDYIHLWDKAQSDFKDHQLKAVTWNNIRKSVEILSLCQIKHAFSYISSADSVHMWKVCRKRNDAIWLHFPFRFGFGVYVKLPLL